MEQTDFGECLDLQVENAMLPGNSTSDFETLKRYSIATLSKLSASNASKSGQAVSGCHSHWDQLDNG